MKVLVADKFEESGRRALAEAGFEVLYEPDLKEDALTESLRSNGVEVLVVRSTKVTRPMLETGHLSLVVRAGAGYNTIDVEAASERGISVANCPGKNSIAVAELAFGLILALDRRIPDNAADLKRGVWNKKEYGKARGLFGRTLGLIGVGGIGCEMIPRARAFGMPVVAWSRSLTDEKASHLGVERRDSIFQVAAAADVVSVHVALKPDTTKLIGEDFFGAMRPGAFFVNTSRAEVVDQAALERAVRERGIRAGLDVFAGEPSGGAGTVEDPIFQLPGVVGTHHIGASTDQAQDAIALETVRMVDAFLHKGEVPNCVNVARRTSAKWQLIVRHHDKVGVLAGVLHEVRQAGINAQEIENTVFEGGEAACCKIQLDNKPADEVVEKIRAPQEIIFVDLVELRA